jgi:hypothetical protein
MSPGARIEKGEIKIASNEGPLDQALDISIDDHQNSTVIIENVLDENDIIKRCPASGEIDGDEKSGENSIIGLLEDADYIRQNLKISRTGKEIDDYDSGKVIDKYAVDDVKWLDEPRELIWKSILLAQLQSKYYAFTNYKTDATFEKMPSQIDNADKEIVISRARQLAEYLQDLALAEMQDDYNSAKDRFKNLVSESEKKCREGISDAPGGITEEDIKEFIGEDN